MVLTFVIYPSLDVVLYLIMNYYLLCEVLILQCFPATGFFLVIPEDVAMGFTTYFGFAPRILKGNDHRVGFGFRFGNHADLQVLYEFGPQIVTKPLQEKRVPSSSRREVKRPFIEFLLRTGLLQKPSYQYNIIHDSDIKDVST